MQRIHMIAIGGSVMHQMALALHNQGYEISGSDDQIFDPARQTLADAGLLPERMGWNADRITADLDAVIAGMHAKGDNPELQKAQELGIKVYSFPEFVYEKSRDKQRIVIAGSHGKTTITSMVIHVLHTLGRDVDYVVGATLPGLKHRVRLTADAPIVVVEGDEYPSSALDPRPKFLHYHHHLALISGIAWDHINVYPDQDAYVTLFEDLADTTPKNGCLVFNGEDEQASFICRKDREDVVQVEYTVHPNVIKDGVTHLVTDGGEVPLNVFGKHNVSNLSGAMQVCVQVGVKPEEFYQAIQSFTGASSRLELLGKNSHSRVYKDFAHAPSKVTACTAALQEQFPDRTLVVALELHTFSSLDPNFIDEYRNSLNKATHAAVYYNVEAAKRKGREAMSNEAIKLAFGRADLEVFNDEQSLMSWILGQKREHQTTALMSSANFNGLSLTDLADALLQ